jgi:hypothetical protein
MTLDGSREQAAALALLRRGLVTQSEAAMLTGASKQLVRHWCLRRGIDTAAAREAYLRKAWRAALRQRPS